MIVIELEQASYEPKYIQLAEAITKEIKQGNLGLNDKLPSVNTLSSDLNISRETVFKALNLLSQKGIIKSFNRKGYYVQTVNVDIKLKVFVMMDKLTAFKEEIYHTLYDHLKIYGEVDVFFHHHNFELFKKLITENLQNYTHFVIVTFLKEDPTEVLNMIPDQKGIILDCFEPKLKESLSMIYQDFSRDIFNALVDAEPHLKKYDRLILIAPNHLYHGEKVKHGFQQFCNEFNIEGEIACKVTPEKFKKGNVYITVQVNDIDDVEIIKLARKNKLTIGQDIGIISYNDTPVKEVLEGGITVITTDFKAMGENAANLIINHETKVMVNPTRLIVRNSL